jgi:hypothetical protein
MQQYVYVLNRFSLLPNTLTMKGISNEHNTTTILPVPIDLFAPFIKRSE